MTVHLVNAIERLKRDLRTLATLTEDQLQRAVTALTSGDRELAKNVILRDQEVDDTEVEIEEECLQILALYQPVAHDLRFVVAVLKINNDLERIGDYAVNVAQRALVVGEVELPMVPIDVEGLAAKTLSILRRSLEGIMNTNAQLAREVCQADYEIDRIHTENYSKVEKSILQYPNYAKFFIQFLSISRYLERIADLSTNIAEDIIYLVEGKIVRHRPLAAGN